MLILAYNDIPLQLPLSLVSVLQGVMVEQINGQRKYWLAFYKKCPKLRKNQGPKFTKSSVIEATKFFFEDACPEELLRP
jgi:hypothetical protein